MSKFVIECPQCGKFAEAKTGFFARKTIQCSCGNTIDVRTDKMAGRQCPHCNNMVVFDQSKGSSAKCPVCREPVNTAGDLRNLSEFSCVQCGVRLRTTKGVASYTCPVCDCVNDVAERLKTEEIKHDGLASIIKYEGNNDTFVWKHPIEDFNYGSQLIVHESQEAIFFKDGQALDLFGAGRYTLETQQLPLLENLYRLPTDTEGTFHSEVYFINKTVQMGIKWGTPDKVRFIDPLTGTPLELGASGELNLMVKDARRLLLKLIGTMKGIAWGDGGDGFTKSIQAAFRPVIINAVKTSLPVVIKGSQIDLLEIDSHLAEISAGILEKIQPEFEEYGLTIPQLYVTTVVLPDNDPNFKRIRELHTVMLQTQVLQAEATVRTVQAQTEAAYRTAQEQSKATIKAAERLTELESQTTQTEVARREAERQIIAAQAEAEAARMAGMTEAAVMQAKGYNQRDVLQAEVQRAYAEGIGQMGSNGGGGGLGDVAALGVTLGAMGGVIGMTREAVSPMFSGQSALPVQPAQPVQPIQPAPAANTWDCSCGRMGIPDNFCPNCGTRRPAPVQLWDCACGRTGIDGNFCPNCGSRRAVANTWDCSCGRTGIDSNFCPNCGKRKGE